MNLENKFFYYADQMIENVNLSRIAFPDLFTENWNIKTDRLINRKSNYPIILAESLNVMSRDLEKMSHENSCGKRLNRDQ